MPRYGILSFDEIVSPALDLESEVSQDSLKCDLIGMLGLVSAEERAEWLVLYWFLLSDINRQVL